MNYVHKICLVLTIIGGINWGLVGLFDFDLVTTITGGLNMGARVIYVIIAIAAIINILLLFVDLSRRDKVFDSHHRD
ncbi:MAG: DUF378 domain-containing protein [Erysipelotrichaceae bacterium]|nr:DUF378 domain-containing protein [Erysipelotrichaceae bacterium]